MLPAVIIVDPNTGQKMHEWRGRIDADRFMEDVVPFLDISPADPKAGTLVSASVKQLAFQNRHVAPVDVGSAGVAGTACMCCCVPASGVLHRPPSSRVGGWICTHIPLKMAGEPATKCDVAPALGIKQAGAPDLRSACTACVATSESTAH